MDGCGSCLTADPHIRTIVSLVMFSHGTEARSMALEVAQAAEEAGLQETAALYRAVVRELSRTDFSRSHRDEVPVAQMAVA
jgi:hypothetical protein